MIKIAIKDEMSSILNKEIIIRKFARTLNEIGYDVNKYVMTEYFEQGSPCGYEINFTRAEDKNVNRKNKTN